jgi:predicted GH43/DUF377 family glycosyl hydrolase
MAPIALRRTSHRLLADTRRVIAKPYLPGEEIVPGGDSRAGLLMRRVLLIPEPQVQGLLAELLASFASRHRGFERVLEHHFELCAHHIPSGTAISRERRLLIGAYFTHEYSIEGAAFFNPSIVPAPAEPATPAAPGEQRFVLSVRAVGEGHISSIEFRTGRIDGAGDITIDPPASQLLTGERAAPVWFRKRPFSSKLSELGAGNDVAWNVLDGLGERFTLSDLEASLARLEAEGNAAITYETTKIIRALAASNYVSKFPVDSDISQRVLFPAGPHETRGMEDARFVRFSEPDGTQKYFATYTAFDGFEIIPQLIETEDFRTFSISTLNGGAAQNKGMALFPRRIGGQYVMLSRKDRENLYLSRSDDLHFWNDAVELYRPSSPWELLQIGNCGSPLETEAGWLVLTHGVGPMRRYVLGALLLDRDEPGRVKGYLREPLMSPDATEREGYVPNVLYSCGGLIHGQQLILPYGFSDSGVGIATVSLPDLLTALCSPEARA